MVGTLPARFLQFGQIPNCLTWIKNSGPVRPPLYHDLGSDRPGQLHAGQRSPLAQAPIQKGLLRDDPSRYPRRDRLCRRRALRLLLAHPGIEVAAVGSVSFEGKPLSSVYPALRELCDLPLRFGKDRAGPERSGLRRPCPTGCPRKPPPPATRRARRSSISGADFRLTIRKPTKPGTAVTRSIPRCIKRRSTASARAFPG